MRRYVLARDYHASLSDKGADWAVYDSHDTSHKEWGTPIAVFAKRGDAIAFRAWKEAQS